MTSAPTQQSGSIGQGFWVDRQYIGVFNFRYTVFLFLKLNIEYSLTTNFGYKVYRAFLNFGILHEFQYNFLVQWNVYFRYFGIPLPRLNDPQQYPREPLSKDNEKQMTILGLRELQYPVALWDCLGRERTCKHYSFIVRYECNTTQNRQ